MDDTDQRGPRPGRGTIQRMDNIAIVVDDLDATIGFFAELGLELEDRAVIEGDFADRTVGLRGIRSEIAMMRTPDGHGRLELTKYLRPGGASVSEPRIAPPNTIGLHRVMFAVDDIDDTVARLSAHGASCSTRSRSTSRHTVCVTCADRRGSSSHSPSASAECRRTGSQGAVRNSPPRVHSIVGRVRTGGRADCPPGPSEPGLDWTPRGGWTVGS